MHKLIRQLRTAGSCTARRAAAWLHRINQGLRSVWSTHRGLLDTNSAYAAAVAAAAASIVGQVTLERFLVAVASAALAIYLAVRGRGQAFGRAFAGFGAGGGGNDWDDDGLPDVRPPFRAPRWGDR
jgi:hypothetical protein